jgi:hypothetical protein
MLDSNSNEDKDAMAHRAGTLSWVWIARRRWDWTDQRVPQFGEQREDRRGNRKRKREGPSEFDYGPKQVRVRAETRKQADRAGWTWTSYSRTWIIKERKIRPSRWGWRWANIIGKTLKTSNEASFSSITWSGETVKGSGARWDILKIRKG